MPWTPIQKTIQQLQITQLARAGRILAYRAYHLHKTTDQSHNLSDSIGWAVYFNGSLKEMGYANDIEDSDSTHKGWRKRGIPPNTGRGWLQDWCQTYKPKGRYVLVVVAAAFYARILEDGAQVPSGGTKYKIITTIVDDMEREAAKVKGRVSIVYGNKNE
jgi:hypothetical protein